jgi:hypothetical protein
MSYLRSQKTEPGQCGRALLYALGISSSIQAVMSNISRDRRTIPRRQRRYGNQGG